MSTATPDTRYGAFTLGGAPFALPMDALREVIPCRVLEKLPNPSPCVVGAINLRGVMVPVVDLCILLKQPVEKAEFPSVVIMAHEGKLLGLLVDDVKGIFSAPVSGFHPYVVADAVSAVVHGSVHWAGTDTLVGVLSPKAIADLDFIPMVADPEPHRQRVGQVDDDVVIRDESLPLMLIRCGRLPLAIDALAVHTTVSDVVIHPSPLAMGHCLGVMHYAGLKVPVMDLPAMCGLGWQREAQSGEQAFILSLPQGFVACLVSQVVDVVRIKPDVLVKLVDFSMQYPRMFAGTLPLSELPAEVINRTTITANQYLLIDAAALRAHEDLLAVSQTNTPIEQQFVHVAGRTANAAVGDARPMIVFSLLSEMATPIEQVVEILPYSSDAEIIDSGSELLGLIVNRGRSIPVLCLSRLLGGPACPANSSTSVLVVAMGDQHVGFAISQLKSIETAVWQPDLPSALSGAGGMQAGASNQLAQMGQGAEARMIPVVDLQKMAAYLCRSSAMDPANTDCVEDAHSLSHSLSADMAEA